MLRNLSITLVLLFQVSALARNMLDYTATENHETLCYTQGLFFINETHVFESCGQYNRNFFHVMEYDRDTFELRETYRSAQPWNSQVFLEGAVLFKNSIYMLTWREHIVYKLDPVTFGVI